MKLANIAHPTGLILVTDAMSAMGLEDGKHSLGSMNVVKRGRCAKIIDTDTLAGSVVSMDYCLQSFKSFTECDLAEAISKCTLNPHLLLRSTGVDCRKGIIAEGMDADFVLLNDNLEHRSTWISGCCVYEKELN